MDPLARTALTTAATLAAGLTLAGCGGGADDVRPAPATSPTTTESSTPSPQNPQEDRMELTLTLGEQRFTATLADSPAAARIAAIEGPVTVTVEDAR